MPPRRKVDECIRRHCVAREAGEAEAFATPSSTVCVRCQATETAKREQAKRDAAARRQRSARNLVKGTEATQMRAVAERKRLVRVVKELRQELREARALVFELNARVAQVRRQQAVMQETLAGIGLPTFRMETTTLTRKVA